MERKWRLDLGSGDELVIVLPRMDIDALSEDEWSRILKGYGDKYRFVVLDVPELICQTRKNGLEGYTIQQIAMVARRIIGDMREEPAVIWGVSMGGMIAQELSVLQEYRGIPLVLVSTVAVIDDSLKCSFEGMIKDLEQGRADRFNSVLQKMALKQDSAKCEEVETEMDEKSKNKAIQSLRAIIEHDSRSKLNKISSNALLLYGAESRMLRSDCASEFVDRIQKTKIVIVPESGMRVLEDSPYFVTRVIREFMEGSGHNEGK